MIFTGDFSFYLKQRAFAVIPRTFLLDSSVHYLFCEASKLFMSYMKIIAVVCAALCLECRWWPVNDWPALLSLAAQCIRLLDVELWGPTICKARKQNVMRQEMSLKTKISAFKTFHSIKCKHREAWNHLGKGTLAFNTWVTSIGAWWFLQTTSPSQMCCYGMQAAVLVCSVKCMNKT